MCVYIYICDYDSDSDYEYDYICISYIYIYYTHIIYIYMIYLSAYLHHLPFAGTSSGFSGRAPEPDAAMAIPPAARWLPWPGKIVVPVCG